MHNGGSVAFYEVAATLIPLLFVGGFVIENLRPPDSAKKLGTKDLAGLSEKDLIDTVSSFPLGPRYRWLVGLIFWGVFWKRYPWLVYLVACFLPIAAAWVVFAEMVALDAIVRQSTNPFHAWVVGGTLLTGALMVLLVLWVPWLRRFLAIVGSSSKGAAAVLLVIPVVTALGSFLVLGGVSVSYVDDIFKKESTAQTHQSLSSSERLWLEHLIATSDYRIDRLEAEESATGRPNPRVTTQEEVQARQCRDLERRIDAVGVTGKALPTPCLGE
jgi:membrane protein implicated in regulation of membrane protease activity